MKKILIVLAITSILFGCGNSEPPIYKSGMDLKEYKKSFKDWIDKKLALSTEVEVKEHSDRVQEIIKEFQRNAEKVNNPENAVKLADKLIVDLTSMTEDAFELSLEDWQFLLDPSVGEGVGDRSRMKVEDYIRQSMRSTDFGYRPENAGHLISMTYKDKEYGHIYYKYLKETKFPRIVENKRWLESYEDRQEIIKFAIEIAKAEKLDFKKTNSLRNIKIFVKTNNELSELNKGYDVYEIAEALHGDRLKTMHWKDLSKKIKLRRGDKEAFDGYMKTMPRLLGEKTSS